MAFNFTERLALLIDAKTGGAVTGIRAVRNETMQLGRSTGDIGGQMGAATGSMLSFGKGAKLAMLGAAGAAAFAGKQVIDFGRASIDVASDVQEQTSASSVIFGEFADEVQAFAANTQDSFFIANRAALQAANSFGDLFQTVGIGKQASTDFSIALTALAGDLASFKDIGTDQALLALRAGLVGEAEPLRRLGVFLSEVRVEAEAAALGFRRVNGEFDAQAKVAGRLSIIMKDTKAAQGDQARTAENYANALRRLDEGVEALQENLGRALIPAATEIVDIFNNAVSAADNLSSSLSNIPGGDFIKSLDPVGRFFQGVINTNPVTGPLRLVGNLFGDNEDAADDAANAAELYEDKLRHLGNIAQTTTRTMAEMEEAVDDVGDAFFSARDAEDDYADALRDIDDATVELSRAKLDLADAHKEEARAQDDATRAVRDAERAMLQAQRSVERSHFRVGEAAEDVADAQRAYTFAVRDYGPNSKAARDASDDLEDALFRQKEAGWDLEEAHIGVQDAQEDLTDANAKLVEGSDRVREAEERVEDATRDLEKAQSDLARKAIELEQKQSALQETLKKHPEAAKGFTDFLDSVIAKHPEVAAALEEEKRLLEGIAGAVRSIPTGGDALGALPIPRTNEEALAGVGATRGGQVASIGEVNFNNTFTGAVDPAAVASALLWQLADVVPPGAP